MLYAEVWCPRSKASALTLHKNQHVSHGATWISYPFIIYIFCNLDFQFVYRIVLGSSKRAKEEICIAELRAVQRLPMSSFSARDIQFPCSAPSSPHTIECAAGAEYPHL